MEESRIEITDRLRREGRWAEASKFKQAKFNQLKAEGIRGEERKDQAWDALELAFPPLPEPEPEEPKELEDFVGDFDLGAADLPLEMEWVANHPKLIDDTKAAKDYPEPPNAKALNMFHWAQGAKTKFFDKVMALMAEKHKKGKMDGDDDDGTAATLELCAKYEADIGYVRDETKGDDE
jgi:hypothetical protein